MEDTNTADLLARLDALTARLDEQAVEIARLKATNVTPPGKEPDTDEQDQPSGWSRRDLLLKGAAGLAVTAVAASHTDVAHAGTRTTVFTEAAATNYGAACTYPSTEEPATFLPPLGATVHGLIASSNTNAVAPTLNSAVCGTGANVNGVQGLSVTGYGLYGQSTSGNAIRAEIPATSNASAIAMYGLNYSNFTGPGPGAGGFAIYGLSAKGHGLVGATAATGGAAVVGASNGVVGAYAAAFYGSVIVSGDLTVVGGAKSAAVLHPDGTHRRLYCVESPESWFEDFGRGELACGRAEVTIDIDFAAVADTENYHVFVTAYDHDHQLHVTKRSATGFTVQADTAMAALKGKTDGELTGAFGWRIVAKRKDIVGERLAEVTVPVEPTLPPLHPPQPASNGRLPDR